MCFHAFLCKYIFVHSTSWSLVPNLIFTSYNLWAVTKILHKAVHCAATIKPNWFFFSYYWMSCVLTFLYLQVTQHFIPQYNNMHLYTYSIFLPSNLDPFLAYTLSELFVEFFDCLLTYTICFGVWTQLWDSTCQ